MRSRKLRWMLAGLAALAVVVSVVALWPHGRITRANFDRIQNVMSQTEVEAILGPSNVTVSELDKLEVQEFDLATIEDLDRYAAVSVPENKPHYWLSGAGVIGVWFEDGHPVMKTWCPRVHPLQRLQRLWRSWFPG